MGSGDFGGDRSVEWHVYGDDVRSSSGEPQEPSPGRPRPVYQQGIDETPKGHRFLISIQLPKNSGDAFYSQFRAAAANLQPGGVSVSFTLPIEDAQSTNDDPTPRQIVVEWPIAPASAAARVKSAPPSSTKKPKSRTKSAKGKKKAGPKK